MQFSKGTTEDTKCILPLFDRSTYGRFIKFYISTLIILIALYFLGYWVAIFYSQQSNGALNSIVEAFRVLPRIDFDFRHQEATRGQMDAQRILISESISVVSTIFCLISTALYAAFLFKEDIDNGISPNIPWSWRCIKLGAILVAISFIYMGSKFSMYRSDVHIRMSFPDNDFAAVYFNFVLLVFWMSFVTFSTHLIFYFVRGSFKKRAKP